MFNENEKRARKVAKALGKKAIYNTQRLSPDDYARLVESAKFLDGSEDGIRAACTQGWMIREMAHKM